MLAANFEPKRITSWPVYVEPKLDGIRVLVRCGLGSVEFLTRNGNYLPALDHLAPLFYEFRRRPGQITFDAEATVDGTAFNEGAGKIRRLREAAELSKLTLFDVHVFGTYLQRRSFLLDHFPDMCILTHECWSLDIITQHFKEFREQGFEGAVVKLRDHEYMFRRHWSWMKIKDKETLDVRIYDIYEGKGKYVGMMGGFHCEVLDDDDTVIGKVKVGGGWTDDDRSRYWLEWHEDCLHLKGRMLECEGQERTEKNSVRHPNFLRWRNDK